MTPELQIVRKKKPGPTPPTPTTVTYTFEIPETDQTKIAILEGGERVFSTTAEAQVGGNITMPETEVLNEDYVFGGWYEDGDTKEETGKNVTTSKTLNPIIIEKTSAKHIKLRIGDNTEDPDHLFLNTEIRDITKIPVAGIVEYELYSNYELYVYTTETVDYKEFLGYTGDESTTFTEDGFGIEIFDDSEDYIEILNTTDPADLNTTVDYSDYPNYQIDMTIICIPVSE